MCGLLFDRSSQVLVSASDGTVYITSKEDSSVSVYLVKDELLAKHKTLTLPAADYRYVVHEFHKR